MGWEVVVGLGSETTARRLLTVCPSFRHGSASRLLCGQRLALDSSRLILGGGQPCFSSECRELSRLLGARLGSGFSSTFAGVGMGAVT